jgi:hypothetical protein
LINEGLPDVSREQSQKIIGNKGACRAGKMNFFLGAQPGDKNFLQTN